MKINAPRIALIMILMLKPNIFHAKPPNKPANTYTKNFDNLEISFHKFKAYANAIPVAAP